MSAIAGILRFDGVLAERANLEALTRSLAVGAPDGAGYWTGGRVGLGHCMLRTTEEALAEVQPLTSENGNLTLVLDGRIDNRQELKREFDSLGILLRSGTDAELVLRAYQAWGEESPRHLLGDFAYALWDRSRRQLFAAVDPMRAGQFHYVKTDRFFAFASTDEALLALPGVSREPNEELIAHWFVPSFRSFDPAKSWLKEVQVLLAGQRVIVNESGSCNVNSYWRFEPGEQARFESEAEAQSEFMSVFSQAVRCRLRAAGPVAHMLSGGIDSASIWAAVTRMTGHDAPTSYRTYSAVAQDVKGCRETQCIVRLASGANAHFVEVPSFRGVVDKTDLVREAWSQAHPCDNSILLPGLLSLAASRGGARVMLHGATGDVTTATPQKYIAHLMREGHWAAAWAESRHASRHHTYLRDQQAARLFLSNAWTAAVPGRVRGIVHRLTRDAGPAVSPLNPGFARKLRLAERLAEQHAQDARDRAQVISEQEEQAALLRGRFGASLGLAGYARVGRRYGMEMRDPWGDKRVAEFFLRLPLAFKVRRGWTKYLVRSAFAPHLPAQVAWRAGKEHLGSQFTAALMRQSRDRIERLNESRIAEYLDIDFVRQRAARFLEAGRHLETRPDGECDFVHDAAVLDSFLQRLSGGLSV